VNNHQARFTRSTFTALARAAGIEVTFARYFFQWLFFAKLGVRLFEAVVRPAPRPPRVPPHWINRLAYFNSLLDHAVLWRLRMPFGSSLFVVGKAGPGD
jgi:hypothetical protein